MKVEYKDIEGLVPYEKNAKLHPDSQVAKIARSIQEFGFRNPVLVDGQGEIIAGHGRVLAARQAGLNEVPVIRADDLTEEQVRAYRIADNKLAESDWDWEILQTELDDLREVGLDIKLSGFIEGEIDNPIEFLGEEGGASSPWDRIGEGHGAEVQFNFGDVHVLIEKTIYSEFKKKCPKSNIKEWLEKKINEIIIHS